MDYLRSRIRFRWVKLILLFVAFYLFGCTTASPTSSVPPTPTSATISDALTSPLPDPSGQILFHSNRGGDFGLYLTSVSGAGVERLIDVPGNQVEPQWSPDGQQIAFSSDESGDHEIYTVGADGQNLKRLTENPATDWGPTWTRDGKGIAFASDRDGTMRIYVMDADGTDLQLLDAAGPGMGSRVVPSS